MLDKGIYDARNPFSLVVRGWHQRSQDVMPHIYI